MVLFGYATDEPLVKKYLQSQDSYIMRTKMKGDNFSSHFWGSRVSVCAVVSHLIGLDASNCNVSATFCDVTTPIPPMLF